MNIMTNEPRRFTRVPVQRYQKVEGRPPVVSRNQLRTPAYLPVTVTVLYVPYKLVRCMGATHPDFHVVAVTVAG
ncbi:hypothetical protein GCM10023170_052970 [Phytohabitans houttuyneae]|jgi:hypothetical protein|uniref:Uncharacterized protein n=1 Tax=Phytohabitans houttuyneae TaxID=1076126 RepID=A0A6V8KHZ2_9ACTN|nr:hypothetical protein Phou_045250 [Phytohabitans houttuyneae]